jgi:hypothetical protein
MSVVSRFTAIMHTSEGQDNGRQIPGHALVMQADKPFRGLATFGNNFLSKFEGAEVRFLYFLTPETLPLI